MDNGYIVRFMRSDDCQMRNILIAVTQTHWRSTRRSSLKVMTYILQFSLLRLAAIPVPSKQRFCWHYPMKNARLYQK